MDNKNTPKKHPENNFWVRNFAIDREEAGANLSWGSVIAGAVTFAAVFMVLSLITAALGFGFFSPTQNNALSGVGTSTAIWTVITLLISFYCGGFVAGLASRRTGLLHGFLTWALSILLLTTFIISAISSLLGAAAKVTSTAIDAAGNAAGAVVQTAGDASSAAFDAISENIQDVDTEELQAQSKEILRDTDIPELQPEYLSSILTEARDEITQAGKDLAVHPENSDQILNDLSDSLAAKAETVGNAADRDAIANAVANNTDLTQEEAEEATDNLYNGLQTASAEAQQQLDKASQAVKEIPAQVDQAVDDAKETTEDVSNAISGGAVLIFIGLLIGLAIAALGGVHGARKVRNTVMEK